MVRLLILLFALFLLLVVARLASRRSQPDASLPPSESLDAAIASLALRTPRKGLARLHALHGMLRLMRAILRSRADWSILALLRDQQRDLALLLVQLRQDLRHPPRLPADPCGVPRMLLLSRPMVRHGFPGDPDALLYALTQWQDAAATTHHERMALPLCLRLAIAEQLQQALVELRHALMQAQQGHRLARRLPRLRRPMRALSACNITPALADALIHQLRRASEADLLTALEEHLHTAGTSVAELSASHARSQSQWCETILQCQRALHMLTHLNWAEAEEPADPLHQLLLQDPSGFYPTMTLPSRAAYRARAAQLARFFHTDEVRLTRCVLELSAIPEKDGLLDHVGWYLLEADGMHALQRRLKAPRGSSFLWLHRHREGFLRTLVAVLATLCALVFLHRGYALWLLPPFLLIITPTLRFALDRLLPGLPPIVPQIAPEHFPAAQRTLVVMPTVLHHRSEALPAVRRLLLMRHAMPDSTDLLLFADYADSLTATSGEDAGITHAVQRAMDTLNTDAQGQHFHYLQRSRSYDAHLHRYTGRSGVQGAWADVRQLIAEGTCPDRFDIATLPTGAFHHRYAYVLVVSPDTSVPPGTLSALAGALQHPLNRRRAALARPIAQPDPATLRTHLGQLHARAFIPAGCWLMDPLALHGHTAALDPDRLTSLLLEELGGCIAVPDACVYPAPPASLSPQIAMEAQRTQLLWEQAAWLLPWQSSPDGIEPALLIRAGRRRFGRALRQTLLPSAQLILLFASVLTGDVPVLLLTLLLPALSDLPPVDLRTPLLWLTQWSMLPLRAVSRLGGILRAAWYRLLKRDFPLDPADTLPPMEHWSQLAAALCMVLASLTGAPFVPGLVLSALFGCFPLIHTHLDRPLRHREPISGELESSLMDLAHATWHYFEEVAQPLPPRHLQLKPWRGTCTRMFPDDAGLYLLACLSAQVLSLMDVSTTAQRIDQVTDALEQLPCWHGLPYECYDLPAMTPASTRVDAQRSGIFCVCLLCAAQALRTLLPDLPPEQRELPARLDALAHRMALHRLYDSAAGLFRQGIDTETDTLDDRCHHLYTSPALLLSFAAVMLGQVPAAHLDQLDRTRVRVGHEAVLCSPHGSATDHLLTTLLLPPCPGSEEARTQRAFLRMQRRHAHQGMFGTAECAVWQFDERMDYQQRVHGLAEFALHPLPTAQVIAPYAAALALPLEPYIAHDSLTRLRSHGMLGRFGFFDALDLSPARLPEGTASEPVQCCFSGHQALILCALCNALTDGFLARTMSAIPSAAATMLLLRKPRRPGAILPKAVLHADDDLPPREPPFRREGRRDHVAPDAHVIGSSEASLLLSATGCGVMRSRGIDLTRFTGMPGMVEGLQCYVGSELHFFRLGDSTEGEVTFAEGSIRLTQHIDGLQCTLSCLVDPASATFIHTLEIINLTGSERFLEVADCLIPGFSFEPMTLRADRPVDRALTLHAAHPGVTLCHVLTTADPLISLHTHTDLAAFAPEGSLSMPTSLSRTSADAFTPCPVAPCAGFRARLSLGIRGRATLLFSTRLLRPGEAFSLESLTPRAIDLPSLLTLSRLACRAVYDALELTQTRAALVSRTAGLMLWHGLPHQGAVTPLPASSPSLPAYGLDAHLPLMLLFLYTPDGLPLLQEALDTVGWLTLSGHPVQLGVLLMGADASAARKVAEATLSSCVVRERVHLLPTADLPDGLREVLEAHSHLLLYEGAGSLSAQLDALAVPLAQAPRLLPPDPLPLPAETLRFPDALGGWQEQTDDYVLHLAPATPAPSWESRLCTSPLESRHTPDGSCVLYHRGALLCRAHAPWLMLQGSCFPLMAEDQSRRMQFSPSQITCQSMGHGLDATLTVALLPDQPLMLHTLRLKNLTTRPLAVTLMLAADMGDFACLSATGSVMTALRPDLPQPLFFLMPEASPKTAMLSAATWAGHGSIPAGLTASSEDTGTVARLMLPLELPVNSSAAVTWLLGMIATADEAEQLALRLRQCGVSPLLRQARQTWAQLFTHLTVSTPDPALDLLLNRLLPFQMHQGTDPAHAPSPLMLTDPAAAQALLLHRAAHIPEDAPLLERLLLVIHTAAYIAASGDRDVLQAGSPTLHARCMQALTAVRLGRHGLPLTDADACGVTESVHLGFVFLHALQRYAPFVSDEERTDMQDVHKRLLTALEQHGWDGSWYRRGFSSAGLPVGSSDALFCRLDGATQAWAALALGDTPRTRQALENAWQMLWEPVSGVFRSIAPPFDAQQDPAPTPLLPGFAQNGGQDTRMVVDMVAALCRCHQYEHAWLLLRALNPALRSRRTMAPWLLPGDETADGRALSIATNETAALLYSVVLRNILGFRMEDGLLHFMPHVPGDWDFFSLNLQQGAATWHLHFSRSEALLTLDGEAVQGGSIRLTDDGRIHQVRIPLR